MEYDLSLFSTIASASASFVAIIGGFIASKLIAINTERTSILDRIADMDELIDLNKEEAKALRDELAEDDALEYIEDHIEDVVAGNTLENVYESNKTQRLTYEDLLPYWNRAIVLQKDFSKAIDKDGEVNDDGIPIELATQTKENGFEYNLCVLLAEYEDGTTWTIKHSLTSLSNKDVSWYNNTQKELEKIMRETGVLELQREQLDRQKNALAKPAHMKAGLWIFGLITLLDILLPLVFMRIIPIYPCIEKCAENISLICMAAGLVATFIYLFCLLGWKANETVAETKE